MLPLPFLVVAVVVVVVVVVVAAVVVVVFQVKKILIRFELRIFD